MDQAVGYAPSPIRDKLLRTDVPSVSWNYEPAAGRNLLILVLLE